MPPATRTRATSGAATRPARHGMIALLALAAVITGTAASNPVATAPPFSAESVAYVAAAPAEHSGERLGVPGDDQAPHDDIELSFTTVKMANSEFDASTAALAGGIAAVIAAGAFLLWVNRRSASRD